MQREKKIVLNKSNEEYQPLNTLLEIVEEIYGTIMVSQNT